MQYRVKIEKFNIIEQCKNLDELINLRENARSLNLKIKIKEVC